MRHVTILLTVTGILLAAHGARAQGYYGPRRGPPPGYGRGGWYGMAGCGLGSLVFGPVALGGHDADRAGPSRQERDRR